MFNERRIPLRLFGLLTLLLLPAALLGSGSAGQALAEARLGAQTQHAPTAGSILVLHVYFRNNAERDQLASELGAEEVSTTGGYLVVLSDRATYNSLVSRGLRVEIDQKQSDKLNTMGNPFDKDSFYGGYRTVEEIYAFLDQKATNFPNLVEKIDIGDSWCKTHPGSCTQPNAWNGFDLYVLHITNRSIPGPKPVFWYDAGIHSREIATPEVAMRFIDYLLNNYNTDADARWLVDYQDIWVMPTLNPDGHHMNESNGEGSPTLHRKNADRDDGCATYDQFGTDINRNFPFMWGCCGGSSNIPCDETYRGPALNSEDETQAVVNKMRSLVPDQRGPNESDPAPITTTGTLINMHSNAQQNLYPWGYTSSYAPNRTDLRNIGRHMSSAQVVPPGNGYEYCQNTECLYIVDGDEKNWAYGELGIPAYSLELSGNNFFPEYSCLDSGGSPCTSPVGPGIWPQNKGALLYHSKIVRQPYLLTRGPDTNTHPSVPITVTQGATANLTATINYVWNGSDGQPNAYLQNVATAQYYIDTPPWSGGTAVPMNADDGAYDETTEPVNALVPTGSLSVGRHILFVRGRGVTDYEGFQSWGPVTAVFLDVLPAGGATNTPTTQPTATRTATNGITPDPTPTFFAPCGAIPIQPALTSCQTAPDVYSYSFSFYNESGCTQPATGSASLAFYVSNNPLGPFTLFDTITRTVTFPAGPGNVTFSGTMTETNIPATNYFYYIDFYAGNVRAGAYNSTGVANLCQQNTPTATVTATATVTVISTPPTASRTTTTEPSSTRTSTSAISATRTATNGITPDPTPTFFAPCGAIPIQPALTSCQTAPDVYSYSFSFYNESGCTQPVTGQALLNFYVSNNPLGPFTLFDTVGRTVTFPAGPGNVTFSGTITEPNIPPTDFYYYLEFSASQLRAGAYNFTGVSSLCAQSTPTVTGTPPTATPTSTACALQFTDVEADNTFYANIRCLACRGIINGYSSGCETGNPCFRPGNKVTRGQLAKIASNAAGFSDTTGAQQFADVAPGSTFYDFVWRLANRGYINGYPCGGTGEPCGTPALPYFRPNANITRGQISKIVSNAAGLTQTPGAQQYQDVSPGSTFYDYIWRLSSLGIMQGYPCGGAGEPCGSPPLPYFRPGDNATRGQASKIVANTFFPDCQTPSR